MRHAARTDANQTEIIKALKDCGVKVEIIGLPVDLLTWSRFFCPHCKEEIKEGRVMPVEVKTEDGTFTKQQVEFMAAWPGPVPVVRTPEEAVNIIIQRNK